MKHDGSADTSIITLDFTMFLPHVLFAWYYHNDNKRFSQLFSGGLDGNARKHFWRELQRRKDPRLDVHPMTRTRGWEKVTIALLLHGDGVPVLQIGRSGTKSFETYSIQSVFTSGPSKVVKMQVFGLFANSICPTTMQEIWRILCWSFYFLGEGRWPHLDWNSAPWTDAHPFFRDRAGEYLADGLKAIIYSLKGDLDHLTKAYKLRHYNSNLMCDACPANRMPINRRLLYNNFDMDCLWPSQMYSLDQWKAEYAGKFLHWLFTIPGVNHFSIEGDELHINFLGVSQYTLGSVLSKLIFVILPGNPEENAEELWAMVCDFYRRNATDNQYNNFKTGTFCDPDKREREFPCLKGKGAEVKDLVPALLWIWTERANTYEDYVAVGALLQHLVEIQGILSDHRDELLLPLDKAERIFVCVKDFLREYQKLAYEAETKGDMHWSMPAQFHWFWHWGQRARYLNPRKPTQCWTKILLATSKY